MGKEAKRKKSALLSFKVTQCMKKMDKTMNAQK
jgi:hypothetical protein